MRSSPRSFLSTAAATVGRQSIGALALMTLFSLTEGLGIVLLLPILQLAGLNLEHQGELGRYTKLISGAFTSVGVRPDLLVLLTIFVFLVGARSVLGSVQYVAISRAERDFDDSLRLRLYRAIAGAKWSFVMRSRPADFAHALTAEVERAGLALLGVINFLGDAVMILLYVAIALELSVLMTAMVLVSGAALSLVLRRQTRAVQHAGEEISDASKSLYARTIEHVQSLKAAKTYGAQERNAGIFQELTRRLTSAVLKAVREMTAVGLYFELGSVTILAAAVYVAIRVLNVPPAEILILIVIFARVMPRLMGAYRHFQSFMSMSPSLDNVLAMEKRCMAAAEPTGEVQSVITMRHELRLEGISFSYDSGIAPALRDLTLLAPAGKIIGIVGPSGAGKSTIADLAMGLLVPDVGEVLVDGRALSPQAMRGWREHIGYVAQDTFLFQATVRENLLWARPGASEDEIMAALRMAAADRFVLALAHGLDTRIGDRGITLSQGERQRIALARALLRHPSLLILDEATNSLDSENESRVLGTIRRLRGELTTLLIAHRMSTIRWADIIYVVDNGTVAEAGSWEELSARHGGRFRTLCEAQGFGLEGFSEMA
jgi:ATP-binding cassette, subfamily C, bacterial